MLNVLITPLRSLGSQISNTNFYQGITQTGLTANTLEALENNKFTATLYNQILRLNLERYIIPAIVFNLLIKPALRFITTNSNFYSYIIIAAIIDIVIKIFLLKRVFEMLIYNLILTLSASTAAASDSSSVKKDSICICSETEKTQQLIKGPLYYLSNHCLATIMSNLISPVLIMPLKSLIYGQALIEDYLTNTGACVSHRLTWLSQHNKFALGIGTSFMVTQSIIVTSLLYIIKYVTHHEVDLISKFIIQDGFFNIIWLFYILNIHVNPSILLSSTEHSVNIFKYNQKSVDKIYDYLKPKISKFIAELGRKKPPRFIVYSKKIFLKLLTLMTPSTIQDPKILLTSPPLQLLLAQHSQSLRATIPYLMVIPPAKFIIYCLNIFRFTYPLKLLLGRLIPQAFVTILFGAISTNLFARANRVWLEEHIKNASINTLYLEDKNFRIELVIALLKRAYRTKPAMVSSFICVGARPVISSIDSGSTTFIAEQYGFEITREITTEPPPSPSWVIADRDEAEGPLPALLPVRARAAA